MAEAPEEAPIAAVPVDEVEMPEGGGGGGEGGGCGVAMGGSWWGGWIQAAKDKSVSAIEFVKKDISEFTQTMHVDSDAISCSVRSKLNQETATAATQKMKHGMSRLLDGIKTALIIPPEDMEDDDAEPITVSSSQHIFDRAKARLHAVQIDPGTYCNEPSGSKAEFSAWKKSFDLEGKKGDISELLVAHVQVRALYTQMVPSSVSHADFWQRYFYKLYQLEQEERRRADLKKRADVTQAEDDLAWDDEDDWENMEGGPSSAQTTVEQKPDSTESETKSPAESDNSRLTETTDNTNTDQTHSKSETTPEPTPTTDKGTNDPVTSPTDTLSTISTATDSSHKDLIKDSSAETLTIVSAESQSSDITEECLDGNHDNKQDITTKEKGDIVVVGENIGSEGTSPSSSDSNSHNKESTDEDWEKDFDIEVTEEDLKEVKQDAKDLSKDPGEEEEDWENWE